MPYYPSYGQENEPAPPQMPSMGDLIAASRAVGPAPTPALDPMQLLDYAQRQDALDTQTKRAIPTDLLQYAMQLHAGNPEVGIAPQPDIANQLFQKMGITPPATPSSGPSTAPLLPNKPQQMAPQNSPTTVDYTPDVVYGRDPIQAAPYSMTSPQQNAAGYDAVTDAATGKVVDYTIHGTDQRAPWGFQPATNNPLTMMAAPFASRPYEMGLKNLYAWLQGQPYKPTTTFIGH